MKNPNTQRFWDKKIISERMSLKESPIYVDKNRIVLSYLDKLTGRLLDIGFGYGFIERQLSIINPNVRLYGIDISGAAVETMKNDVKGNFVKASALKIPFDDNKFDCVLALDVLEHFYEPELVIVLNQIIRKLKKSGTLIISIPLNESTKDQKLNKHLTELTEVKMKNILVDFGFSIQVQRFLYAFKDLYFLKSFLTRFFKFKKPNLLIISATLTKK